MSEVAAALARSPIYARISAGDRDRLARVSRLRDFERAEGIFREGDPAQCLYVISTGRAKVFKTTRSGQDVILEIFEAGDPLGAVAVYEGRPFPASATALEPTRCVATAREPFFRLLERYPSLVRGLLSGLNLRLVELTERIAELTGGRVEPRIARLFLKLADEKGRPVSAGIHVPGALGRQEIADLAGTTVETAIRIMSRWGKEGVVRTEPGGFTVIDRSRLEDLGAE